MTWTVNLNGHDDLPEEAKKQFEEELVDSVWQFVGELKNMEGVNVTSAMVVTNTTGSVDVLNKGTN
jgi:hypothetical protein